MQAHNDTIASFLSRSKTIFVVPVYQRNYDWQEDNCKQLFYDIKRVVETGREHFLGTICLKTWDSHELLIIDGQQRLTSLTLMLKAIFDFESDKEIRADIKDSYLYNKGYGITTELMKYKLRLNKADNEIYHILLNTDKEKYEKNLTTSQKKSHIYQNYLIFCELISDYVNQQGGNCGSFLEALTRLTIVELDIQNENPQEIFESLNSTGLDLTNVDLLRNYFLMQFGYKEQTDLYEKYWSRIEKNIGTDKMEQFFVDFLVFRKRSDAITINNRNGHINEKSLYTAFKEYYAELEADTPYQKTEECFSDLRNCAEIYSNFLFSEDINLGKESPIRKKLYFLLTIDESSKSRSLLLYIFDLYHNKCISIEMLSEVIDAITSLTFRAKICKAYGINRQFSGSVMQRLDEIEDYANFTEQFWQAITSGKGSYAFPSDTEFKNALINKDIYHALRSRGVKYFLYLLESSTPFHKGLPAFNSESLSIEHIMPQTLSSQWKKYLTQKSMEEYESSLHRLGNLTLTNYNGSTSNKLFEEKKGIYKQESYYYTRIIGEKYTEWQVEQIDERSEMLANKALEIWKLPPNHQSKRTARTSLHALSEDTSQFAFTKPSMLILENNEYPVNSWSDFLPLLCELMNEENHTAFIKIMTKNKIPAFRIIEQDDEKNINPDEKNFIHITDNVYVRLFMSAASILDIMNKVAKAFDAETGSDYKNNILFSLR